MVTRQSLAARFLKHGLAGATVALLLGTAVAMAGQVLTRSVADFAFHAQSVNGISFQ